MNRLAVIADKVARSMTANMSMGRIAEVIADEVDAEAGPKVGPVQKVQPVSVGVSARMARELVAAAKMVVGMDFPTKDSLEKYLDEHPNANSSAHRVVPTKQKGDEERQRVYDILHAAVREMRANQEQGVIMNRTAVAKELVAIAKLLVGMDFPTQDAYDKYMKEHPKANRSNHKIVHPETKQESQPEWDDEDADEQGNPRKRTKRDLPPKGNAAFYLSNDNKSVVVNSHFDDFTDFFEPNREESEMLLKKLQKPVLDLLKKHGIETSEVKIVPGDDGDLELVIKTKGEVEKDKWWKFADELERTKKIESV